MSQSSLIDKSLFEAGMQCAKRLHLEYHEPDETPALQGSRKGFAEMGQFLVDLAGEAFPKGVEADLDDWDKAVEQTTEFLKSGVPGVIFNAAFRSETTESRTDIILVAPGGKLDIFEIKAGTSVKPRHLLDVALQIYTIELCGYEVEHAAILHLNRRYQHSGGTKYPPQKLFKNVDVSTRARKQIKKVKERIPGFLDVIDDDSVLELPTGTWCKAPLPCVHLKRCLAEGPECPLSTLPQLTRAVESDLHEQAIESITQLADDQAELNSMQRRVVKSTKSDSLIIDKIVPSELADVDYPLAFVHIQWHLDVLPSFEKGRPWQKLPFAFAVTTLDEDGETRSESFVSTTAEDPRISSVRELAFNLRRAGTLVVYSSQMDVRFRVIMEDLPDTKQDLRHIMGLPLLDIGQLIHHGVYHPAFEGEFDLKRTYKSLVGGTLFDKLEIKDDEAATLAYQRLLNSRTRAQTRTKLGKQLTDLCEAHVEAMLTVYQHLLAGN